MSDLPPRHKVCSENCSVLASENVAEGVSVKAEIEDDNCLDMKQHHSSALSGEVATTLTSVNESETTNVTTASETTTPASEIIASATTAPEIKSETTDPPSATTAPEARLCSKCKCSTLR